MDSVFLYMDEILPRLYLGSREACDVHLTEAKITHVLSLWGPTAKPLRLTNAAFAHRTILVDDDESENLSQHFESAHQWIQSALSQDQSRVLVHCRAGISRSPSIIAYHIMKTLNVSDTQAIDLICEKRAVDPNSGFRSQLQCHSHERQSDEPLKSFSQASHIQDPFIHSIILQYYILG